MTSAFWFQGRYSEIDVIENLGAVTEPNSVWVNDTMMMNTHFYKQGWDQDKKTPFNWKMPSPSSADFHVYGVWWKDPHTVAFYHNGTRLKQVTTGGPFDEGQYMFFDTEVFTWHGWPTRASLLDPARNTMLVDWVRAYRLASDDLAAPVASAPTGGEESDGNADYGQTGFPYELPEEKPDQRLSAAMERNYTAYLAPRPEHNELYSLFKYTPLEGFDYHGHDGTISRRDPSKVIFARGKYYVWYTHRHTPVSPKGAEQCTETIPSSDWDLADIWYATSEDGFTWKEQGVAVPRPPKPQVGWRSVTTTDILVWQGKYYLYYQGFMEASGTRGDDCPVAVSWADSPDGPWTPHNRIVIPNGAPGQWDQYSIHDPYPLVYRDKIYLYYKSDFDGDPRLVRMQGLAIADDPLGPFKKHPLNPVVNSGHETTLFPFKQGIAALVHGDGNEHNTVQFAKDGVNFEIASLVELMPIAAGPFIPDAFTNTRDGRGITWGLSHFTNYTDWSHNHAILMRFDCDLSLDLNDPAMKHHRAHVRPDQYFKQGLNRAQRDRIRQATQQIRAEK